MASHDTAGYHRTVCGRSPAHVTYPSRGVVEELAATMTWLPLPGALADDVTTVAALLPDGHALLPAYWQGQDRGVTTDCLSGALVHPALITPLTVIAAGALTTSRPRPVPATRPRRSQVNQACASAAAWTTPAPVNADPVMLLDRFRALAEACGAVLVDVQTHDTPRPSGAPATHAHPHLVHASVLFDRPVTGPLHLDRTLLVPITPD